jgi:hypothetical protein
VKSKILVLEYTSDAYKQTIHATAHLFENSIQMAKELDNPLLFDWFASYRKRLNLKHLICHLSPDYCIYNLCSVKETYLVLEVSFTQSLQDVKNKIISYFGPQSLVVAIIINIQEREQYHQPVVEPIVISYISKQI